jgi:hypothetical protein
MDPKIWQDSKRDSFPYNLSYSVLIGAPMIAPLTFFVVKLIFLDQNFSLLKTVIQTISISLGGFVITDKMIPAFKESLV